MRVLFMGTPPFALPTLEALHRTHRVVAVVTRPDAGKGRGRATAFSPVKQWALASAVPLLQPASLRQAEVQEWLRGHGADVFVVVAYGAILPPAVLDIPPRGCINVHASLLPRHRGAAPIAWAILAGDACTGVTTMLMDEGLDTGPMLLEQSVAIGAGDTTATVTPRLADIGADVLLATLAALEGGALRPRPQRHADATLAPSFKKRDGALDWRQAAVHLERRVRALQPWPGTFTFWGDERLAIRQVAVADGGNAAAPGTVVAVDGERIRVACGDGILDILALQRAGGRPQSAAEFLRGRPVARGERFSSSAT